MRLAAGFLAASVFLMGCATSAGPVAVSAPSLGFESPYLGLTVRGDIVRERFLARAEASVLDAKKTQTGDGWGATGEILAGAKLSRFALLGGLRGNQITTSLYTKTSSQLLAEAQWCFHGGSLAATYSREANGTGWDSYGLRATAPTSRVILVSTWEHLRFDDQQGRPAQGNRVSLAALWKF